MNNRKERGVEHHVPDFYFLIVVAPLFSSRPTPHYPVGLLTEDELSFAGHGRSGYSTSSYLYTGLVSWSSSPYYFDGVIACGFHWVSLSWNYRVHSSVATRPVVSLVPGSRNERRIIIYFKNM